MSDTDDSGTEMKDNPHVQILSWVVDQYDTQAGPVTVEAAATQFGQEIETIQSCFDHLASNHLLTTMGDGYRPTVTARELLALEVDDDSLLVLDTGSETDAE